MTFRLKLLGFSRITKKLGFLRFLATTDRLTAASGGKPPAQPLPLRGRECFTEVRECINELLPVALRFWAFIDVFSWFFSIFNGFVLNGDFLFLALLKGLLRIICYFF